MVASLPSISKSIRNVSKLTGGCVISKGTSTSSDGRLYKRQLTTSSVATKSPTTKSGNNFVLLGPPGSGKGAYGRLLAQFFQIPLITMSNLLLLQQQQQQSKDCNDKTAEKLRTGQLLNDQTVFQILLDHLNNKEDQQQHQNINRGFILDGYPRTLEQARLLSQHSTANKIIALHLDVPRQVCLTKLGGRCLCPKCGRNWNIAHVDFEGYWLPPYLPKDNHEPSCCIKTRDTNHWAMRPDDVDPIILDRRLDVYFKHVPSILEFYNNNDNNALFTFHPFLGFQDMNRFQSELMVWLKEEQNVRREAGG